MIFNESRFFLDTNSTIFSDTTIFVRNIFLTTDTIGFHRFYIVYFTTFLGFLVFSLISLYSDSTLFNKKNSSRLICESIKALEIKTLKVFNFVFADNNIYIMIFFFFLIIDLYLLIPAVIAQIPIPTAEPVIPTGTPTSEANAGIETQPLTAKIKQEKVQLF